MYLRLTTYLPLRDYYDLGSFEWLCVKLYKKKLYLESHLILANNITFLAVTGDCIMMVSSSCRIKKMKKGFQEEMAVICLQ